MYFAASTSAKPAAKRTRLDVGGDLAKRHEQRDREIALKEREMVLKEHQLKLDQQKFDAVEEDERRQLLKFLIDKNE